MMKTMFSLGSVSFLFFLCMLLSACGEYAPANATINPQRFEVSKAYLDAVTALRSFAEAHGVYDDPEILAYDEEVQEATRLFTEFRRTHPELQESYAEYEALFQQASEAEGAGNNERYLGLIEEYSLMRKQIEHLASTLPDLQEAQAEMDERSVQQLRLLAAKVAAVNAEGEGIAMQFQEAQLQFDVLR